MIDHDTTRLNAPIVNDHLGPLILIFQVRRMDMNELVVAQRQINVVDKGGYFVARHPVDPNLTDAQDIGSIKKLWDQLQDVSRQFSVLTLFRIEAQPAVVLDAIFRCTRWLETG